MHNHAPQNYTCPICPATRGEENEATWIKQDDIIYRDDKVVAFIGSKFVPGHEGYPIVVPKEHFENIYDIPDDIAGAIMSVVRLFSVAIKETHNCDGVTIVQNNEPAGDQHAFHYHTHIVPRYTGDNFHADFLRGQKSEPQERIVFANKFKNYLASL